jgi:hypothetical protein
MHPVAYSSELFNLSDDHRAHLPSVRQETRTFGTRAMIYAWFKKLIDYHPFIQRYAAGQ